MNWQDIKYKYLIIFTICIALFVPLISRAISEVKVYFFYSSSCPFCQEIKSFLSKFEREYPNLQVFWLDISQGENRILYSALVKAYNLREVKTFPVPAVFVGEKCFLGLSDAVKNQVKNEIQRCLHIGCPSPLEKVSYDDTEDKSDQVYANEKTKAFLGWVIIGFGAVLFLVIRYAK